MALKCHISFNFADKVHFSNHWILVQALAHAPVLNYDSL